MAQTDFSKCKGELRVLWPTVLRRVRDPYGRIIRVEPLDEHWRIVDSAEGKVFFNGVQTNFNLPLNPNDILDDKLSNPGGPDFLYIKSQAIMDGAEIFLIPLPRRATPSEIPCRAIPKIRNPIRRPFRRSQAK